MVIRRLATQTRDDGYSSLRDYQTIQSRTAVNYAVPTGKLIFLRELEAVSDPGYVAFGGYFKLSAPGQIVVTLEVGDQKRSISARCGTDWKRIGVTVAEPSQAVAFAMVDVGGALGLDVWGGVLDRFSLPDSIVAAAATSGRDATIEVLNAGHLAPETFYFDHEGEVFPAALGGDGAAVEPGPGAEISVKKCAYCSRFLPLNEGGPADLAFHGHKSKLSLHQNECRSCKTWRINGTFNPMRTVDQLNESSLITRERKILLREPQILQEIKAQFGVGLKSYVWKNFGKKCFQCGMRLTLKEVQLDHTRPLAYLWPIDEHATCLCSGCNNTKHDKFPSEYYSQSQIVVLSSVCGLSVEALNMRDVNPVMLAEIRENIVWYSQELDPRTFQSTARRVASVRPEVDLYAELLAADPEAHEELLLRQAERPAGINDHGVDLLFTDHGVDLMIHEDE